MQVPNWISNLGLPSAFQNLLCGPHVKLLKTKTSTGEKLVTNERTQRMILYDVKSGEEIQRKTSHRLAIVRV